MQEARAVKLFATVLSECLHNFQVWTDVSPTYPGARASLTERFGLRHISVGLHPTTTNMPQANDAMFVASVQVILTM